MQYPLTILLIIISALALYGGIVLAIKVVNYLENNMQRIKLIFSLIIAIPVFIGWGIIIFFKDLFRKKIINH
ncbi:hypothetical protein KAR28_04355 [Candidatus Parcubacteria bacterium]|nr:hypothetical protein [Candidatus Parcubacteria bacterium]